MRKFWSSIIPFVLLISLIGSSFLALNVYKYIVEFSGNEKKIQLMEAQSGKFGILLGARGQILASSRAIWDSPILGHGSWAKDPKYIQYLYDLLYYDYKIQISDSRFGEGLIPSHSHIFGAWVEAGIFGAIFWVWVLFIILRVLLSAYKTKNYLTILILFFTFWFAWSIGFDPFGAQERLYAAFNLVLLMTAYDLQKRKTVYVKTKIINNID